MPTIQPRSLRSTVDLIATLVMAIAAILLVARTNFWPVGGQLSLPPSGERTMEDIEAAHLSTDLSDVPRTGDSTAPVALIEFADFECPFCERFARETFQDIERQFIAVGDVQYIFRNFPLEDTHKSALDAAGA